MVLVQPQSIPKSTSGKPSRSRCQRLHENNILSEIYRNEDILHSKNLPEDVDSETTIKVIIRKVEVADNVILEILVAKVAQVLETEKQMIVSKIPPKHLWLDCMALAQLQGIISQRFQIQIQDKMLYGEDSTLRNIASYLTGKKTCLWQEKVVGMYGTFQARDLPMHFASGPPFNKKSALCDYFDCGLVESSMLFIQYE